MHMTSPQLPEHINPTDLSNLSDEEIDLLLMGIRQRRMQKLVLYNETVKLKEEARLVNIEGKLDRKLNQFLKQLDKVEKALEKLENYANEVNGLRIQLGVTPL